MIRETTTPLLLRHWPPGAVQNPRPALLATLEGHSGQVRSVSVTPDGRRAISASTDKTLRSMGSGERAMPAHARRAQRRGLERERDAGRVAGRVGEL